MKYLTVIFFILSFMVSSNNTLAGWEKLSDNKMNIPGRFLSFGNVIIAASDSGIYRSTDSGKSWTFTVAGKIKRPDNTEAPVLANSFSRNDKFVFASTNASLYASEDSARTWKPTGPMPILSMMSVYSRGSYVFASMAGGGVFRSTDNGSTWSYLGPYRFYSYTDFRDMLFAAAFDGLWFSADLGQTWKLCQAFDIWPMYIPVFSFANNDRYIFASCWDKIYRTADEGKTIQQINGGLPFNTSNVSIVYCADNLVFAGFTNNRVYFSRDDGDHWSDISEGLDTAGVVNCFGVCGGKLLVSKNNSLWSYSLSQLSGVNEIQIEPGDFKLSQNYPNPFNPVTTIRYYVPSTRHVSLEVFDMPGRKIATLVYEVKSPGNYEVKFDGSAFAGGSYFYRLQAGEFSEVRKFVLIK